MDGQHNNPHPRLSYDQAIRRPSDVNSARVSECFKHCSTRSSAYRTLIFSSSSPAKAMVRWGVVSTDRNRESPRAGCPHQRRSTALSPHNAQCRVKAMRPPFQKQRAHTLIIWRNPQYGSSGVRIQAITWRIGIGLPHPARKCLGRAKRDCTQSLVDLALSIRASKSDIPSHAAR